MKKIGLLFLISGFVFEITTAQSPKEWKVFSPDKSLQLILSNDDGKLTYRVLSGTDIIVKPSRLGIETANENFTEQLSFVKTASRKIDEQYMLKIGKRKVNHATGNEMSVSFRNAQHSLVTIDLRAYNDGVAFRYRFTEPDKKYTVTGEATEFAMPEGKAWLEPYDLPTDYTPAYEANYANGIAAGTNAKDSSGWAFPVLFQTGRHWVLLTETNLDEHYFGAHLQQHCEGAIYKIALPLHGEAAGTGSITATAATPFASPWRLIIAGKSAGTIVESNLVYDLADPNKLGDVSWVKPGRASWSWWSDHPSSREFSKLKDFVDLAVDMGWEYSLVDANWNIMQGGNIDDLVKYASAKKIGLSLWYNSGGPHNHVTEQPRDIMGDRVKRKEEFAKLHAWGVKAVKVDFFGSDKQSIIQLYFDILKDAAKEKIMVIFHGCTLPRGWSRTYPNLLSMEAVKGAEQYGWDSTFANHAAEHNTILTFTRNVVGPMDYTPVTFSDYACCPHTTSNAHELALSVAFESGMLHFADNVSAYEKLDTAIRSFLKKVPNTWDDTRFIQGEPGSGIVLARRSGNVWYIAGLNGENSAKPVSFKLSFLKNISYQTILFSDGANSREIKTTVAAHKNSDAVSIAVLPKGGFVMVAKPQ